MRNDQLIRQWRLLSYLATHPTGTPLKTLQTQFGVTKRTIQRDIAALQKAGFDLIKDDRQGTGFWKMRINTFDLSSFEQMTLLLGDSLLQKSPIFLDKDVFHGAVGKLTQQMLPSQLSYFEKLKDMLHQRLRVTRSNDVSPHVVKAIQDALLQNMCMTFYYPNPVKKVDELRRVAPYEICLFEDSSFLLSYCLDNAACRTFTIGRMHDVTLLDDPIPEAHRQESERHYRYAFGVIGGLTEYRVKIRFLPPMTAVIKTRAWDRLTPMFLDAPDGSTTLTFTVADLREVANWVMHYHRYAFILEPPELREMIRERAEGMLRNAEGVT